MFTGYLSAYIRASQTSNILKTASHMNQHSMFALQRKRSESKTFQRHPILWCFTATLTPVPCKPRSHKLSPLSSSTQTATDHHHDALSLPSKYQGQWTSCSVTCSKSRAGAVDALHPGKTSGILPAGQARNCWWLQSGCGKSKTWPIGPGLDLPVTKRYATLHSCGREGCRMIFIFIDEK